MSSPPTYASPLLGTPYIMSLSTPSTPTPPTLPNASICHNLSLFKSHLLLSRSYDDSIVLRLNRSEALSGRAVQGRDRISSKASECEKFWSELHGVWEGRNRVLELCANGPAEVVAAAVPVSKGKREKGGRIEDRLSMDRDNGSGKKASTIVGRGETEAEVVKRQIRTEIQVEKIIRSRSLALFFSRCPEHPGLPAMPSLNFPPSS